jgi:hypothetical protein
MRPQEGRDGGMNVGRSSSSACALRRCTRILHKLGRFHQANGLLTPQEVAQAAATPWEELVAARPRSNLAYTGVYWKEEIQKWGAYATFMDKRRHLGYFEVREDAARVVDTALLIIHDGFERDPSR